MTLRLHEINHCYGGQVVSVCPTRSSAVHTVKTALDIFTSDETDVNGLLAIPTAVPFVIQIVSCFEENGMENEHIKKIKSNKGWFKLEDGIKELDYHTELQALTNPFTLGGYKYMADYYGNSTDEDFISAMISHCRDEKLPKGVDAVFLILSIAGKVQDKNLMAKSSVINRHNKFFVVLETTWTGADFDGQKREAAKSWCQKGKELLKKWIQISTYVDSEEDHFEKFEEEYKLNAKKLKKMYDPENKLNPFKIKTSIHDESGNK